MFRSGRRLYSIAAILMFLTACVHTFAFASNAEKLKGQIGGLDASVQNTFWTLAFVMSITFAALGALNLVVAAADASDRLLRRLQWTNLIWILAFTILSVDLHADPGVISGGVIGVIILADLIVKQKAKS